MEEERRGGGEEGRGGGGEEGRRGGGGEEGLGIYMVLLCKPPYIPPPFHICQLLCLVLPIWQRVSSVTLQ